MGEYLVELYMGTGDPAAVAKSSERARTAAEELSSAGVPVRYVRSLFVPADETCFHLYEAASASVVRDAALLADLTFERVVEAVSGSDRL